MDWESHDRLSHSNVRAAPTTGWIWIKFTTGKVNYIAQVGDYIYSFTHNEQILSLGYLGRYASAWLPLKIPHLLTFKPYLQDWIDNRMT